MELRIIPADPAGNITLLVESPVPPEEYGAVASRLLALPDLRAEQVGYFVPPRFGGAVRLEMMGGEFCGNALRCAGLYAAKGGPATVPVEISGCARPLLVRADPAAGTASASMPLPKRWERLPSPAGELDALVLDGIAHLLVPVPGAAPWPAEKAFPCLKDAAARLGVGAAGLMFLDEAAQRLTPVVYVRDTDSLVYENSCASGSTAAAVWLALRRGNGRHRFALCQSGGVLTAEATVASGAVTEAVVGGAVRLAPPRTVTI